MLYENSSVQTELKAMAKGAFRFVKHTNQLSFKSTFTKC